MDAINWRGRQSTVVLVSWSLTLLVCLWSQCHCANAAETPGFVFVPKPLEAKSRLIWITNTTWMNYVKQMDEFLLPYQRMTVENPGNYPRCTWNSQPDRPEKSCLVNVGQTGSSRYCNKALNYGYNSGRPCILLYLNKIIDWKPEPYTREDTVGSAIPNEVREAMEKAGVLHGERDDTYIWFNCEGEFATDKEKLGAMNYSPMKGVPTYYFPYRTPQQNYLIPFITLHLHGVEPKIALNVVCRAYAKNIKQDVERQLGATHFQILIDYTGSPDGRSLPDWPTDDAEPEHGWGEETESTDNPREGRGRSADHEPELGSAESADDEDVYHSTDEPQAKNHTSEGGILHTN